MGKRKADVFSIATAHLDTSWLWTLEQTIDDYIPDTVSRNFEFFEKYPEYKFNFEGSLRYEYIKEYYPDDFEKIKKYATEGRWHPCGACYENGDVNIPSPEALTRNILYGNGFFEKELGVKSNDIFLPDCFGFGRALPSVAAHSGLTGFSTGKLFWGSSVPIPFDTGKWTGPDGKGVWAALMPFSYTTIFRKIDKAQRILGKIRENEEKGLPSYTFAYHGNGDRGGAPHKKSIKNVVLSQRNNDNADVKVYSATTKEFFDKVENSSVEEKEKLPVFNGEFLLTAHGAGSYTARTVTKRWNRRCELLADAAERAGTAAFINGFSDYPQYALDSAWKQVITHHFHDDITGTSHEECYLRNHNDYVQALNTFSAEYTAACKAVSEHIDTSFAKGIPVIVSNPLQCVNTRKEAVKVTLASECDSFRVFDRNGIEIPSQTRAVCKNKKEITFIAEVNSCSLTAFDVREAQKPCEATTGLRINNNEIENNHLLIKLDANGDLCSIFDKRLQKELLKKPLKLCILNNTHSLNWPAWEIKYEDLCNAPYMYVQNPEIRILDCGPALCSFEITRTAGKSKFTQIVSLDCESEYIYVYNETDWREEASLLKAEFSFTAENENASYDIGMGYTLRGTNTDKLCEVPAQKWADITDKNSEFGVSIFSDSRVGWDKPDKNTLRLTLVHTPMANYRWECSQHVMDMGINRYSFAVMGHEGSPENMTAYADCFSQPLHTFITEKHGGQFKGEYSLVKLNNDNVRISAIKKAQNSDSIILRVTECSGKDTNNVEVQFSSPIIEAIEIWGDEKEKGKTDITDGKLVFHMSHNEIKSFALKFADTKKAVSEQKKLSLNFNATGITEDGDTKSSTLNGGISVPGEIIPDSVLSEGINYRISKDKKNCLVCDGSEIVAGEGFDSIHLLAASLKDDRKAVFESNGIKTEVLIQDCFEALGHWDLMMLKKTGYIKPHPQALTLSHTHGKNGNITAKQFYLFHCEIPLNDADRITLPVDDSIVIFSATAVKKTSEFIKGDEHFDSLSKRRFDYEFSAYAEKRMKPAPLEKFLDKFFDRTFTFYMTTGEFANKFALAELYFIIRNTLDKLTYKKHVDKLLQKRK